jgi:putative transposase
VVFIPTYRRKALYGQLRAGVGRIVRELCDQKGVALLEGHAAADHVHLFVSIPLKYRVAPTVGFLKGKSAVRIPRGVVAGEAPDGAALLGHRVLALPATPPCRARTAFEVAGRAGRL